MYAFSNGKGVNLRIGLQSSRCRSLPEVDLSHLPSGPPSGPAAPDTGFAVLFLVLCTRLSRISLLQPAAALSFPPFRRGWVDRVLGFPPQRPNYVLSDLPITASIMSTLQRPSRWPGQKKTSSSPNIGTSQNSAWYTGKLVKMDSSTMDDSLEVKPLKVSTVFSRLATLPLQPMCPTIGVS